MMKNRFEQIASFFVVILILGYSVAASRLFAASPDRGTLNLEAERQGYTFLASRNEIEAGAKKEGRLRAMSQLDPRTNKAWISAFKKRYPFIDVQVEDATGTDPQQRMLLELKSGRSTGWDVYDIAPDFHAEYLPHIKKTDILRMAAEKVLAIPTPMIDPKNRNAVSIASSAHGIAYNRNMIAEEKLPKTWDDFLKAEFKGKKFLVDTRPQGFAALAAGLGEKWAVEYGRKVAAQEPVWSGARAGTSPRSRMESTPCFISRITTAA